MSDTDPQGSMEKSTEEEEEKWEKCPSPESPRKPVKSTAVVKYTKVQVPANFARLQCNTNLNLPPSNWLSSSAESYGLQNVPLHSSGFSSFCMAHMFPDCVGEVDVVSDAENIKNLLKIPYSKGPVSMMVHRVENTLLIDEFDIHKHLLRTSESEWQWLKKFFYEHVLQSLGEKEKIVAHKDKSRCALQQKSLVSKFLYHSLVTSEHADTQRQQELETSAALPVAEVWPPLPEPQIEEELPDPLSNHKFARNVVWTFEDIQMLIGTDLPIFGGATHPCITLRLRDASKPISVLTGIDYWLDNLMCNVPELVMCYHLEGIVQKYELIKTEDLPHLENSKFSPKVIRDVAQNILSFLKANATKAGHTYWLFKGKDAEVVKLYDLTSLCTEVTDEKGQNPFTIPVAMLLYRVARNMKHSSDGQRQQGTIRMLLKNCIMLLPKEKYPQIVTSAHYMLSDLYIPADTDPVAPGLSETIADEGECEPEDEEEDEEAVSKSSSVAVKSLCLASGEGNRKFSPPQQPLPGGVADRCKYALQHITAGLACLPFFDFESHEEENSANFMEKNEENLNMARPFEAIPMPYEPINKDVAVDSVTPTNSGKRRKDSLQNKCSSTKSVSKQKDNHPQDKDLSPKSLLCSMKAEAMPTWQMPAPGDNRFWKSHLKILLYEKARLVYATRAEMEFVAKSYGSTLRNISHVLCCQRMLEMRSLEASNSQSLESYLLGRAGDICFMVVQDWARVDRHREDFARVSDIDREILKSDKLLKYDLEPIPREIASMGQMLLASYRCYQRALNLKSHNQEKNNLLRRLGNTDNELGVLYMNQASAQFQEKGLCQEVEHLLTLSQRYLEEGVKAFETVHDSANLALLLSNTGRLMRTCAHLKAPAERTSFSSSERNFYEKAMASYQKAIQALGTNKNNPTVWNTVMWEMSTTLFTMASLLQDHPGDTKDETEREVADLLLKSLKYCDLDTPGPRQPAYQYRAAAIHHRLATLYNRSYRSLAVEDPKRRNVLQVSRIHYEKASNLLLLLENTCDFLGLQLERINFCEYQAAGMPNFPGKMKCYHFALEILLGCLPVIKLIEDRNRTADAAVDRNAKSKKKRQENKKTGKGKSCDEVNKENETESNSIKNVEFKADEDEEGEEQKLLLLLEQRLQYILLCITKLYHTRSKKETESQQSEFYRRLYSHSLRKASGGDSNMPHHLRSILVQLSPRISRIRPDDTRF